MPVTDELLEAGKFLGAERYQQWVKTTGSPRVYEVQVSQEVQNNLRAAGQLKDGDEIPVMSIGFPKPHFALMVAAMGICGEAGELVNKIRKHMERGDEILTEPLIEELGDINWFLNQVYNVLGVTQEDVLEHNVAKLIARHGTSYNPNYKSDYEQTEGEIKDGGTD
jgi:NTP pyrophosphatase (non-canonical NTP hydrolase)